MFISNEVRVLLEEITADGGQNRTMEDLISALSRKDVRDHHPARGYSQLIQEEGGYGVSHRRISRYAN